MRKRGEKWSWRRESEGWPETAKVASEGANRVREEEGE